MKNKGSVTIFCCLMITAIMILGLTVVGVVGHHLARAKGAIAIRSAMSGAQAGYNSYIFQNYHILLFDKNCDGKGEAYLEEQLSRDIQHNLGEGFLVEDIGVSSYDLILDSDCQAFKTQLEDYCGYALLEGGAESILESTGGRDGTVGEEIYADMDAAEKQADEESGDGENKEGESGDDSEDPSIFEAITADDPRDFTKNLSTDGILALVVPEDMDVNDKEVELDQVPSSDAVSPTEAFQIDNDFADMDILRGDIGEFDSWKESLISGGAGVIYAAHVFNCATDKVQEETVFDFELEYIICGKESDQANLKGVVNRIMAIRFPVNFAYLVTDGVKMAEVASLSAPLAVLSPLPEPVIRYLIAGCWSYVEAIADVRSLLKGESMDFLKTSYNWKTDLNDFEGTIEGNSITSESGLDYKDYLLILLALDMDSSYYRMLDIIELNTRQYYESFDMNNAVVGFCVDTHISYEGKSYYYRESIGY